MENVGRELLSISNVLGVIYKDEMATRVLVENALQSVGSLLYVLLPLSFEEMKALTSDHAWVRLLQILNCSDALVEGRVRDFARNCNFDWDLVLGCNGVTHL